MVIAYNMSTRPGAIIINVIHRCMGAATRMGQTSQCKNLCEVVGSQQPKEKVSSVEVVEKKPCGSLCSHRSEPEV